MTAVSIITPCYNLERYVEHTVRSVLAQTLSEWEYVLVDDGSTDRTGTLIDELAALDPRVRVIHQVNAGAPAARVAGYKSLDSSSRYLLWLDGDDVLEPDMLEILVDYLDARPLVGVALCNRQHIDHEGNPTKLNWRPTRLAPGRLFPKEIDESTPETPFGTLFVQDAISSPSATLMRRSVYDQTRGWDTSLPMFEDWDLIFNVALVAEVHYLPLTLTRYRVGRPGQLTMTQAHLARTMYRRLYDQWSRYEGVPRDKLQTVRQAIRFREGSVLPVQHFIWGVERLRSRELVPAAVCFARALRSVGQYWWKISNRAYRNAYTAARIAQHV